MTLATTGQTSAHSQSTPSIPRVGMLATVRNQRGIISEVEASPNDAALLHLVKIDYLDSDSVVDEHLVWELEPNARLIEPTALPAPDRLRPMSTNEFDALVRATRWGALTPYPGTGGPAMPLAAPFHGAIQVEDFQLTPLLKALRMPRISLLIADDVGLGKTIEAGLILSELLIRRRIRRVLILSPASLRGQWKEEMHAKFALSFDIMDRDETHSVRKQLGLDANPWRVFPRIITSYHYLKQPDVLESFIAACRQPDGSAHLPWDLLIVDEVHNLAPAPLGEDSDLTRMLRTLAPYFEHKIFLSATPHNGHTRSFTGILEMLDPVRFTQTSEISPAERSRIDDVLIRRLKSEINERTNPKRFCTRHAQALHLRLTPAERNLSTAFQEFRHRVHSLVASSRRQDQLAGNFAVEILGKRLLSCPYTFADSWHRYRQGLRDLEKAEADEVRAASRAVNEDTGNDSEAESRVAMASHIVGAWLKPLAADLQVEMTAVETALNRLGLSPWESNSLPIADARYEAICTLIDSQLRTDQDTWSDSERLVIFTEYKTTLDYLRRRLVQRYQEPARIITLTGGMEDKERSSIKQAFNDPTSPVRILIATDAAAEGLNLQETACLLLHMDVPWNPARLEQRNGRLDRHGQARDVNIFHFTTQDDADLQFLAYVIAKVDAMRDDLGSVGEVFEAAFERRFIAGEASKAVQDDLDKTLDRVKNRANVPRDSSVTADARASQTQGEQLKSLAAELDLDAVSLRDTLEIALGIGQGMPRFDTPDPSGRVRLRHPLPSSWSHLIDESLRLSSGRGQIGALPALVFDASYFIRTVNGRPVYRSARDTALLHLAHPLFQRALATFARSRFEGASDAASRWTLRRAPIPAGADALLLLTVEERAVNELRESFHHWVHTLVIPVRDGELGDPLPHIPAMSLRDSRQIPSDEDVDTAIDLWLEIEDSVRSVIKRRAEELTATLSTALERDRVTAQQREQERFASRQGELSTMIQQQTLARLEREIEALHNERLQGSLFDNEDRLSTLSQSLTQKEAELTRRRARYQELRAQLARERQRILENLIPNRYRLRGDAQVFPVAIEIRLPESLSSRKQ